MHAGCVIAIPLTMQINKTPYHLKEEGGKEEGSKVIKTKGERRSFKPKRERGKRRELCGRAASAPVHQRFYIHFIHNDVVDCRLLLRPDLLLILLLLFVVLFLKGVWASRRSFSVHIQADDTEHSKKWVFDMWAHKDTPVTPFTTSKQPWRR